MLDPELEVRNCLVSILTSGAGFKNLMLPQRKLLMSKLALLPEVQLFTDNHET